jgi:ribonucleoside-diphosphate reductase alpha chain
LATYEEAYREALDYYDGDELPAKTFVDKYALRDKEGDFKETIPTQMQERTSKELYRIEKKYPNPRSYEEIFEAQKDFKYFSLQGSGMFGVGNPHSVVSFSNCFVIASPDDDLSSIMEQAKEMANIFARRGGVGIDISTLRPDGEPVNNAAKTTTGAWSFADLYSYVCRLIGQSGRRGALMISMDVRHPDIFKFATMKRNEDKVTGANISIKLTDKFMEAVRDDTEFTLQWPIESEDPKVVEVIKARDLWEIIIESAHGYAEPGLIFWDAMMRNLPAECYKDFGFKHVTCNPCGELILPPGDSCRLLAMNLNGFVINPFEDNARFDFKLFKDKVALAQRMMDNLVDLELEAIKKIIGKSDTKSAKALWKRIYEMGEQGRRTGLGYLGLADVLAQLGIRYDSEEGMSMTEKIDKVLCHTSYEESINMAEERGPFPIFDWELEKNNDFIKRLPARLRKLAAQHGRRNISNLTNAPTGSLSIEAFNSSSGIEPVFKNSYDRNKKINPGDGNAKVDFIDELGDKWQKFSVFHKNTERWIRKNYPDWDGESEVELPDFFVTAEEIDWEKRVKIQGIITSYRDHSVSSTINLPTDIEKEVVSNIYLRAWEEGLKGVTVYREGSRRGILVSKSSSDDKGRPTQIKATQAPRRPSTLPCDVYHGIVQGEPWTIVVGMMGSKPYELFGGPSDEAGIPKSVTTGYLEKIKASKNVNKYDLIYNHYNSEIRAPDISSLFENRVYGTFTRMLSLSLRHGTPVQHIVEQLGKDDSEGLYSLSSILRRALKKYIEDGARVARTSAACDQCGSGNLKYADGCPVCLDCGFTKCGG